MAEQLRIVIATGGTGGHLFPAIQLAKELTRLKCEIYFLGSFGTCIEQLIGAGFRFENLYAKGLKLGNVKDFLVSAFSIVKATLVSIKFLYQFKPHAVIGFGGYGAFPVVFSAALLGFPTMIHEQNVIPGKANKILAKIVKKVAISFEDSQRFFNPAKVSMTGYPLNLKNEVVEKPEIYHEFKLFENRKTILVFGGSQGSHTINKLFLKAAKCIEDEGYVFQVIHASGEKDYISLKEEYSKLKSPVFLSPFINQMSSAYKIADVVIARAGAGTVTELGLFRIPSILIPYPYAGGHQKENAAVLVKAGLACMIEEKDLTIDKLINQIKELIWNDHRKSFSINQNKVMFVEDSVERLAKEVLDIVKI